MKELLFGKVTTYKGEEFYVNRDGEKIYIYTWDQHKVDKTFIQISDDKSTKYKKFVKKDEIGDVYRFEKCFELKVLLSV